ncbi:MAG: Ig domain-containing protein, partial [Solirubrobacteraceae bacterium]
IKAARRARRRPARDRSGRVGVRVRVRIRVRHRRGLRLSWRATGLPPGLSINRGTGLISGRPRRAGTNEVRIRVRDRRGVMATIALRWRIAGRGDRRGSGRRATSPELAAAASSTRLAGDDRRAAPLAESKPPC